MIEIIFKPAIKVAQIQVPKTLLDIARESDIAIRADCGGMGVCGKCLVRVLSVDGDISPPTLNELNILGIHMLKEGYRLACQARVLRGKVEVYIPRESLIQRYRSADIGLEKPVPLSPAIKVYRVSPSKPSLNDPLPDFDRILIELEKIGVRVDISGVALETLKSLPEVARKANWDLDIVLWYNKVVDIRAHSDRFRPLGVAVDIGTSKIVVHLVDLTSGETIAVESTSNPQASYGADIISRLSYAIQSNENLAKLQTLVVQTINMLIKKAVDGASASPDWVYEVVIVGNTVMHHLFVGLQPKYLGLAPYTPTVRGPLHFLAKELDININSNGVVYLPPVVAGFVGSDAIADAVAVGIDECEEPCILIDIGTNTEILINTGKSIVAGSTPAGPAFEGATMTFGMRAIEGAIDQAFIYYDGAIGDYVVKYSVIGGGKPNGICGSGYIDLIANLYRVGLINNRGKFVRNVKSVRFIEENDAIKFVVAMPTETSSGKYITIDEKDIDSLLLAKAAIASGLKTLLHYTGLDTSEISKIFIAGSFGSYLNIENAIAIGLLPRIPISRYVFVGNAAVVGAKAILKSKEVREKAVRLSRDIKYIEIAARAEFRKIFIESLYLP